MRLLGRLLFLERGQLERAWPFFALYLLLFAALTLADGLALALFVRRVGAAAMPMYQGLAALGVLVAIAIYMRASQWSSQRVFLAILAAPAAIFLLAWLAVAVMQRSAQWLGVLFLGREIAFTLVLLHFGHFLLDYFTRDELKRVMPFVYGGGRLGGIAGGAALCTGSLIPTEHLILVAVTLLAIAGVLIARIGGRVPKVDEEPAAASDATLANQEPGILQLARQYPLIFWISVSTLLFFPCRIFLNYQYSLCFQETFHDETQLATFLGTYTQIALVISLLFQLFVVGRLVDRFGIRALHLTYASLLTLASGSGMVGMTISMAVGARFIEGELRFGLRNPLAQMMLNELPKRVRLKSRAWTLGMWIPLSTLAASAMLALMLSLDWPAAIAAVTLVLGCGYLATSWGLVSVLAPRRAGSLSSPSTERVPSEAINAAQRAAA